MKRCPLCGATADDAARICYECLYSFELMSCSTMVPEAPVEASETTPEAPAEQHVDSPAVDTRRQPQLDIRHRYRVEVEADRGVEQYPLESGSLYIGRLPTNDVVLNDKTVSRRHLHIFVEDGEIVAQDLESTNPSLLNGRPLRGRTALKDGDELRVRSARVRLVPIGLPDA